MNLKDKIRNSRNIKEISLNSYMARLKKLNNNIVPDDTKFLYNSKNIMKKINLNKNLNSRMNLLSAVKVALSIDDNNIINKVLIKRYSDISFELHKEYNDFIEKQKMTKTQFDNWINYKELIDIIEKLKNELMVNDVFDKYSNFLSNKNFKILQIYVILKCYIQYPFRNNYSNMKVVFNNLDISDDNQNYILIENNDIYFVLNTFKNVKSQGRQRIRIKEIELNKLIRFWLSKNTSGWFIVKTNRNDTMNSNDLSKYLSRFFKKIINKNISTSLLRHILITHDNKDDKSILDKKTNLNKYLHSGYQNDRYRKIE
jgi:Ni,Fe-hydrogenase III component G